VDVRVPVSSVAEAGLPAHIWAFPEPALAIASTVLGGGVGRRHWAVNATVPTDYDRVDPDVHLAEIAATLGLRGPGVGMLTAVAVGETVAAEDGGVHVVATVGLGHPTWAAAPDGHLRHARPGTVNVVAWLPVPLAPAALVNSVITATEAKAQALWEYGVEATGTASDALCVASATSGTAEPYAGPRSRWGARLARAVYMAVAEGTGRWLGRPGPSLR
jgi:adenosylcobinamide amidohydrolase